MSKVIDWLVDRTLSVMLLLFFALLAVALLMPSPYEKRFWLFWLPVFGATWVGFFLAVWLNG